MTFREAAKIGVVKQMLGWILVILASISTFISILKFLASHAERKGPAAVVTDFTDFLINILRHNTQFLQLFWHYSPTPVLAGLYNLGFWLIYVLIFIGLAVQGAGARMWRQSRFIKEKIEDLLILEAIKPCERLNKKQLMQQLVLVNHPFYRQYFRLLLLPILVAVIGWATLKLAGLLG